METSFGSNRQRAKKAGCHVVQKRFASFGIEYRALCTSADVSANWRPGLSFYVDMPANVVGVLCKVLGGKLKPGEHFAIK